MSDVAKILVFSLFLSVLWLIPRLHLAIDWMAIHIWQSIVIGLGVIASLIFINWIINKRANRRNFLKKQSLNVEKSES
jgi:tetrahydromethanopterin S-methyltransferase subunit E